MEVNGMDKDLVQGDEKSSENINEASPQKSKAKIQHGRDFLLQLRLHPLSLQRPKNLPNLEILKDMLYLHHINHCSSAQNTNPLPENFSTDFYYPTVKADNYNSALYSVLRQHRNLPAYFARMYPFYFVSQMCHNTYQNAASAKYRSPYVPNYTNPLRKHTFPSYSSCKIGLPTDEILSSRGTTPDPCLKRFYASENTWSSYQGQPNTIPIRKKEFLEVTAKNKKKLSIIDPKTGQNVLEALCKDSASQENGLSTEQKVETHNKSNGESSEAKFIGDHTSGTEADMSNFCEVRIDGSGETTSSIPKEECPYSNCSEKSKANIKSSFCQYHSSDEEILKETLFQNLNSTDSKSSLTSLELDHIQECTCSLSKNIGDMSDIKSHNVVKDIHSLYEDNVGMPSMNEPHSDTWKMKKETGTSPEVQTCFNLGHEKESYTSSTRENTSKYDEQMRENVKLLRAKLYAMRQEHQKMTILQSFLRYKKHQLDEASRNLDDKKIEMANWEYSLYTKAKRLQDKEYWLESKREVLKNREQQLNEIEQSLSKKEKPITIVKVPSKDAYVNTFEDMGDKHSGIYEGDKPGASESKAGTECENLDITQSCETETKQENFIPCDPKLDPNNSTEVFVKLDVNKSADKKSEKSTDEKETCCILKENKYSFPENIDHKNKSDTNCVSSDLCSGKRSGECNCLDRVSYSKGRKYLPEHIKFWLNNRDKILQNKRQAMKPVINADNA